MTDAELVIRKLAILREHVARARRRRPATADALSADVDVQDSLSLSIIVAIQEAIDTPLASFLAKAVGLRNRLSHAYATLDMDRLWSELPAGLDALDRYAEAIARFLPPLAPSV